MSPWHKSCDRLVDYNGKSVFEIASFNRIPGVADRFVQKTLWIVSLGLLVSLTLGTSHATDLGYEPQKARIVPPGWVADYDYKTSLRSYLRSKYEDANGQGKIPHAYLFDDTNKFCREIRKTFLNSEMMDTLDNSLVIMLDFRQLRMQHSRNSEEPFPLAFSRPVMLKIASDGRLTGPTFYPANYVFLTHRLQDRHVRTQAARHSHNRVYLERLLARELADYLEATSVGN